VTHPTSSGSQRPDVSLLDEGSSEGRPEAIIRGLQSSYRDSHLIVIGMIPQSDILGLVRLGVSGFVLKDASIRELVASIASVADGQNVLPASLTASLFCQIVEDAHRKCAAPLADVR